MRALSTALFVLALLAPPIAAGGLDKTRVPERVRWLAHVDIDALRTSVLFGKLEARESGVGFGGDLQEIRDEIGLDPIADLHSITVWCAQTSPEGAVLLLAGSRSFDGALAKLRQQADWRSEAAGGRILDAWGTEEGTWYSWTRPAREPGSGEAERLALASRDRDQILLAIAVLEGGAPSLASEKEPLIRASPAPGSIVFAATGPIAEGMAGSEEASAVVKLAQSLVIDLGETRGEFFATLRIRTARPEDAQRVQQVIQGAVALVGLMGEDPEVGESLARLAGGLKIACDGDVVTAEFRCAAERLVQDLEALDDR